MFNTAAQRSSAGDPWQDVRWYATSRRRRQRDSPGSRACLRQRCVCE